MDLTGGMEKEEEKVQLRKPNFKTKRALGISSG